MRLGRVLSWGWLILGVGLIAEGVYEAWIPDLLFGLSNVLRNWPVFVSAALALVLGVRLTKPGALRTWLGYPLAILILLYGLYMITLVLGETGAHPVLAAYAYLGVLSAATIVFLLKEVLRSA